jgi:hypothetical protein
MTEMMVKIMVQVLDILGIATKEMKQSRFSEVVLPLRLLKAYVCRNVFEKGSGNNEAGRWSEEARQNDE